MSLPPLVKEKRPLDECELTHGGKILRLNGQVYLVEHPAPDRVLLLKDDGEQYLVKADFCSCRDHQYRHKTKICKHRSACMQVGLIPDPLAERN